MLSINNKNNPQLQHLSNQLVGELNKYRNTNYVIPTWAKNIPNKASVFKMYGSPNVFNEFNPHFSIFYGSKVTNNLQANFNEDINSFIKQYNYKPESITSETLNIGIANEDGQMVKIVASYPLHN